MHEIVLNY